MSPVGSLAYASSPHLGATFPGYSEDAPLTLPADIPDAAITALTNRIKHGTWHAFASALAGVSNCAHPISLVGRSTTYSTATGEVVSEFSHRDTPLNVLMVPCGNRRASVCPACSRVYAADTFHAIRSGVTGGKTVPETVADNPLVFATLTAPSFGRVHNSTCGGRRRDALKTCRHGEPTRCTTQHGEDDPAHGTPLCEQCYDYTTHVVWQWWAPELWRRFTIALKRQLASHLGVKDSRLKDHLSVQFAKVGEYQKRGVIHFHALIRLDGPKIEGSYAPAPAWATPALLAEAVTAAVAQVTYTAPPTADTDVARTLRFGTQTDVKIVAAHRRTDTLGDELTSGQVAGYLAKYSTKAVTDTANVDTNPHYQWLERLCRRLANDAATRDKLRADGAYLGVIPEDPRTGWDVYALLGKWSRSLGFRGHFSSRSRKYSITLGALRRARKRFAAWLAEATRTGTPLDTADLEARLLADDEEETTLVIGEWKFAGTGWGNQAETELALAAAARAREYDQWKATRTTP